MKNVPLLLPDPSYVEVLAVDLCDSLSLPYFSSNISAGFPSPAEDYLELRINIGEFVTNNPTSTFWARVHGDSMQDAHIVDGSILAVDKSGYKYKKSGVVVADIIPDKQVQLNLLDQTDHGKEFTLMQFIDDLTEKFGGDTMKVAAQGTHQKKAWNLNREHLSPCYTTRLQQILTIKI